MGRPCVLALKLARSAQELLAGPRLWLHAADFCGTVILLLIVPPNKELAYYLLAVQHQSSH